MRSDGRKNDQVRHAKITRNYIKHAEGSVLIEVGDTKVICTASIEEKVPPFLKGTGEGWITAEYNMLPRSTATRKPRDIARLKVDGRTMEIQRLIGRALRSVVDLKALGEKTIWIDCDVIQADGGTRTASICGGFVALSDAVEKLLADGTLKENPIIEPVGAISAGIVDGEVRLDLNYEEDSHAQVDSNVVLTKNGKIIEFQTTAEGEPYEFDKMVEIFESAKKGIQEIIEKY